MAIWLVFPLLRRDVGQDTVPFSVAGAKRSLVDFIDTSRAVGKHTASFANNGSPYRTGLCDGAIVATAWLIRFVAVVPLARAYLTSQDDNAKWSFTWLAALLFFPYVWGH